MWKCFTRILFLRILQKEFSLTRILFRKNSPSQEFFTRIIIHKNSPSQEFSFTRILHKNSPSQEFSFTRIVIHKSSPSEKDSPHYYLLPPDKGKSWWFSSSASHSIPLSICTWLLQFSSLKYPVWWTGFLVYFKLEFHRLQQTEKSSSN